MLKQQILEKLKILASQLSADDKKRIEAELSKMVPSEKSFFEFSCGYADNDDYFSGNFNFRIVHPQKNNQKKTELYEFFVRNLELVKPEYKRLDSVNKTLDKLIEIQNPVELILYPATFVEDESGNFIAGMFSLKKKYR